jgi:hypothetical protein
MQAERRRRVLVWVAIAGSILATIGLFVVIAAVSYDVLHGDRLEEPSSLAPVRIAGDEQTVFIWERDRCEDDDIPDLPARAFRDAAGRVQLIAAHYINRRFIGPSLDRLSHPCRVTMDSGYDANPARFDDREWLAAPYTEDGRTVHALVHDEYQGNTHPDRCPSGDYSSCWYNAITLAVSRDGGTTFRDARAPPRHLVAAMPYRYVPDAGPYGVFNPSNILQSEDDGHYYTLVRAEQYQQQERGTCLLRTTRLHVPASWRAWDASGFTRVLASPYGEGRASASDHTCEPVSPDEITTMHESLTYNTYLAKYLLVGVAGDTIRGRVVWGIYYSVSDDLIRWSRRKLIREVELPWTFECGDSNPILYPSLIDHESPSRNFETTGRQPYMYFTRFHYDNCVQGLNRDLVRVRLQFSR